MESKFNLIHEHEWTGNTVTGICKKYGVSRKTYYKWKNRYFNHGIDGTRSLQRRNMKTLNSLYLYLYHKDY